MRAPHDKSEKWSSECKKLEQLRGAEILERSARKKQMSSELEGLCKSLSSLGVDWNERMAAMQRVRDLVAVDTGATVEAYACLAKPLGVQVRQSFFF